MPDRTGNLIGLSKTHAVAAAAALLIWMLAVGVAWPQAASPPSPLGVQEQTQQAAPDRPAPSQGEPVAPSTREDDPGVFHDIGKMLEKSLSIFSPLKSPGEAIDDLNTRAKDATKDATDTLSRLAKPSSIATGRMKCPVSANGAADCKAASDKLCQTKGFKEGKGLTTDAVESCSAKVLIPGRTRKPDDCRTDNFVTSALCQ